VCVCFKDGIIRILVLNWLGKMHFTPLSWWFL